MQTTLLNHPRLRAEMRTGREGPRHDPYSYEELRVGLPGKEVVLHDGLAVWFSVNGARTEPGRGEYDSPEWRDNLMREHVGFTRAQLERIHRKVSARCPAGGYHDTHTERGYPGETFEVCCKCHKIVDSYFNESAIR